MRPGVAVPLLIVAVIHLLPLYGVLGAAQLATLYGVTIDEPNLVLLMRHRAVLFGLIGAVCVIAAFKPALQVAALSVSAASVAAFMLLMLTGGGYNAALGRAFLLDIVALLAIVVAAIVLVMARR